MTSCDDIRAQPGIKVSAEGIGPADIEVVDGVRVTTARHSVLFEMRRAETLADAVRVLDMAACSDLVSLAEVRDHCPSLVGSTGIPLAREAVELGEENAWSPLEVDLRLIWCIDAGWAPPLCNRPIFDLDGKHVATPDLFDAELGVVGQYEGRVHLAGRQRTRDLDTEDELRRIGVESFVVVAGDLGSRQRIVEGMEAARRLAIARASSPRRWTTEPPHWWVPTWSVDQRRRLDDEQRRVWLGYRAVA